MASLYEITGQIAWLNSLAEEGEVEPQVFADTFEALEGEFEDKAEQYGVVYRNCKTSAAAIKAEIDRLTARMNALDSNAERCKETLEQAMITTGKRKFKTKLFSFGIRKAPVSLGTVNEEKVPAEFWVQHEPTIDRRALLAAVKADPERFKDIATTKQTEYIRID